MFLSLQYLWEEHLLTAGDQGDHTLLPHSQGVHLQASLNQLCPEEPAETENSGHTRSIRPGFLRVKTATISPKKCCILHKNLLPISAMFCPNSSKPIAVLTMAPSLSRGLVPSVWFLKTGTTLPLQALGGYCDSVPSVTKLEKASVVCFVLYTIPNLFEREMPLIQRGIRKIKPQVIRMVINGNKKPKHTLYVQSGSALCFE